jgi:hypothetical protein
MRLLRLLLAARARNESFRGSDVLSEVFEGVVKTCMAKERHLRPVVHHNISKQD